jgi:hypothetical protein
MAKLTTEEWRKRAHQKLFPEGHYCEANWPAYRDWFYRQNGFYPGGQTNTTITNTPDPYAAAQAKANQGDPMPTPESKLFSAYAKLVPNRRTDGQGNETQGPDQVIVPFDRYFAKSAEEVKVMVGIKLAPEHVALLGTGEVKIVVEVNGF